MKKRLEPASVHLPHFGESGSPPDRVFDEAEAGGVILLFDEADALFGKRTDVSDAHDRYANIEVSYLLQKMEEYEGVAILATNLQQNMDDAFLRRIPYKVEVIDPDEESFRELFRIMGPKMGLEYRDGPIDHLIENHYRKSGRPFRCCQPRDLLAQIRNHCLYVGEEPRMTNQYFDFAVENYFAVM